MTNLLLLRGHFLPKNVCYLHHTKRNVCYICQEYIRGKEENVILCIALPYPTSATRTSHEQIDIACIWSLFQLINSLGLLCDFYRYYFVFLCMLLLMLLYASFLCISVVELKLCLQLKYSLTYTVQTNGEVQKCEMEWWLNARNSMCYSETNNY